MTPLRQRMIREMELQRMSEHTIKGYVMNELPSLPVTMQSFARFNCRILKFDSSCITLITQQKLATSTVNLRLCAIRFFYRRVLGDKANST